MQLLFAFAMRLQALAGATVLEAVFIMYRRLMLGESIKWTRAARVVESKGEHIPDTTLYRTPEFSRQV